MMKMSAFLDLSCSKVVTGDKNKPIFHDCICILFKNQCQLPYMYILLIVLSNWSYLPSKQEAHTN